LTSASYEVVALRYATRATTKRECYYRFDAYGEPDAPLAMDYFFYVLRDRERVVLVDTGFDPEVGRRRGRTLLCPPLEALGRLGVAPDMVAQVIVTHFHYDHIGNLGAFPAAELVVQQRELDFWAGPAGSRFQFAAQVEPREIAHVVAAARSGRVRPLQGSELAGPGISAVCVGGHSPGQQVLVVDGAEGQIVLASDALHYYEELELDRPFEIFADLEETYRAFDTLRELAARPGALLVAGHDPLVCERFPAVTGSSGLGFLISS
jgi:glyoxylase-like metal-dependent hydrolase (beta-lactamase superfamily II)